MSRASRFWTVVIAAVVAAGIAGCGQKPPPQEKVKLAPRRSGSEKPLPRLPDEEGPVKRSPEAVEEPARPGRGLDVEKTPAEEPKKKPQPAAPAAKPSEPARQPLEQPAEKPVEPAEKESTLRIREVPTKSSSQNPGREPSEPAAPDSSPISPKSAAPPSEKPSPVPAGIPRIEMSQADAATCRIKVGDTMPDAELPDASGKPQSLAKLLGEKLTVVVFWTAGQSSAQQELSDVGTDVLEPYGAEGVRAVAIAESCTPEDVKAASERTQARYPILLDRDGALWAKVATERLPRTYVLDAAGRVLWLDLGYSRTSREDLLQTIRAALGKGP